MTNKEHVDSLMNDLSTVFNVMSRLILDMNEVPYVKLEETGDGNYTFAVDSLIHITKEEAEVLKRWGVKNTL